MSIQDILRTMDYGTAPEDSAIVRDWLKQQRALQHLNQGGNVVLGGVSSQLFECRAVGACGISASTFIADGIGDQQRKRAFVHRAKQTLVGRVCSR